MCRVAHRLRDEEKDVRHQADVGIERLHQFERFWRFPALRLMHRKALFSRKYLQRIFRPTRLVRSTAHRDDILSALEQSLEHRFAEGLLAVDDDTHLSMSLPDPVLRFHSLRVLYVR